MPLWYNKTMEIYRHSTDNQVVFEAPAVDTVVSATASLDGGPEIPLTVESDADSKTRHAKVPFVPNEGTVKVRWTFTADTFNGSEEVTVTDTYDVVTPVLTNQEIREIHPNATPNEITRVERAVRHIIQAHTGQRFGKFVGVKSVRGAGSRALMLPNRLLSINTVDGRAAGGHFLIGADGWVLYHFPWGVPPVKADFFGLHMHTGGVIHNPNNVRMGDWLDSQGYEIDGEWGWEEVPPPVREAAKLLVNDYACADQAYRDRYLTSMTAADWRIQFHSGAFRETGNVRADQLLNNYVLKRGWAVV